MIYLNFFDQHIYINLKFHFQSQTQTQQNKKIKRNRNCKSKFIDDEARVSGSETSGDDSFIETQSTKMFVDDEDEEDNSSVDMQAKYMQSIL